MKTRAPHTASRAASSTAQRLAVAARVVARVTADGRSLDQALQEETAALADPERAPVRALAFGTIRWWPSLECLLGLLLDKPAGKGSAIIPALAACGLHQLRESTHPQHAIVSECVEATRLLRVPRTAGLVNALLRRYLRERRELEERLAAIPAARFAHPNWLIEAIAADWPGEWESLLEANNRPAPMWLRVNRRRVTVEDYLRRLQTAGIAARPQAGSPDAVLLEQALPVHELPGFRDGEVSVQDAAAQKAAELLDARPGMRVLDACAAPGGKACHVLERTPGLAELVALDISAQRLQRVRENIERLGLEATIVAGDARTTEWWDGRLFDRILVDAPCSGTGVIRRHPDIKLLRRPQDIEQMAASQRELLRAAWPMLARGGRLVYATCSVLAAENEAVVEQILRSEPDASEARPSLPGLSYRAAPGARIETGEAGMDGFYYACIERAAGLEGAASDSFGPIAGAGSGSSAH